MSKPLISIIIATYNRCSLIGETLDSIFIQTYENWECIIVDDWSTDDSGNLINTYVKKDSRFQYHKRPLEKDKGGNASRNYGFEISNGDFIIWFDDDDVMLKDFLKTLIDGFSSDISFVITSHYMVDENLENRTKINLTEETYLFKDYLFWKLKLITGSILFKKEYLVNKRLFNEKLTRGQETEFFSRLFFKIPKNNYKILNIPLFLYRQHNKSKSRKNINYIKHYKTSQSYTAIEILKKSIVLNDKDLVALYFKFLIDTFFRSLENNHKTNAKYISKNLFTILKSRNLYFSIEFMLLSNLFLIFSRGIYKIEKRWKLQKISI